MAEEDRGGTDRSKTKRTYTTASSRMNITARVHTMSCTTSDCLGGGLPGEGGGELDYTLHEMQNKPQ